MFTLDYFYCYGIIREDYAGIIASPFREIHSRPTGLFSEPSYWGAFCGYMWPLCAICLIANYPFNRLLILCLLFICLVTPFIIRARTFIGILTVQLLFASFICKKRWFWFPLAIAALIFILPLFNEFQLFDIHENLSSAMRLGSTILGLNLSKEYGFFGLGLGQFTYFYSDKYAPDFLLYSEEAMSYFTGEALFRASTYNLFVRALVELGFLGFIGFTMLYFLPILYVYKNCYKNSIDKKKFWFLFLLSYVGAIAFQLTQDSLLYSPAIFFIAFSFSSCAQLKKAAFVR